MPLPRIYFDTNAGTDESGYWLGFDRSKTDLISCSAAVAEGAKVIIYMPDELEMMATLRFDPDDQVWRADPIPGTVAYLDGSA